MVKEYTIDELCKECCPSLNNRIEISNMSINETKSYKFDVKALPILNEKLINTEIRLDISSEFNPKLVPLTPEEDDDYILHLLLNLKEKQNFVPKSFISYSGTLTKIAGFPYEKFEDVTLSAIKLNGNIFLWWFDSGMDEERTWVDKKNIFGGYRLEKLVTNAGQQNIEDSGPLYQSQFFSGVTTNLSGSSFSHDLFCAGQIDCIKESTNKYVEIKSRIIREDEYALKRYCFLKWWLQSYLIGIETVVVGYKDDDFIVERLVEYDINEFYPAVRSADRSEELWNPKVCMSFLGNFLTETEKVMKNYKESDICIIEFQRHRTVTFRKTNQAKSSDYDFLPEWFRTEWIRK